MEYYCLMVRTGEEEEFKEKAQKAFCEQACAAELYYFQRTLKTNQGKLYEKPLFPGYLFFQTESLTPQIMQTLKKIDGFIRILLDNINPIEILGTQLEELRLFIGNGEHWGISKVEFMPEKNIRVISGPLMGLEGKIYKVNKKRGRVTIITTLNPDGKKIDLAFECVQMIEK